MTQAIFGEMRSVLHAPHSTETWTRICALLDEVDVESLSFLQEFAPYIREHLEQWPAELRPMPLRWFIEGQEQKRSFCSCLNMWVASIDPEDGYQQILRFWPDGHVASAPIRADDNTLTPSKLSWFTMEHPNISKGTYTLDDTHLTLRVVNSGTRQMVASYGLLLPDRLCVYEDEERSRKKRPHTYTWFDDQSPVRRSRHLYL